MIAKVSIITIIIVLFLFLTLLYIVGTVYAHVEKGTKPTEETVVSKYTKGRIDLSTNPESKQWKESSSSSEIDIQSIDGHTISVNSLNNGTYLFFLLSWNDNTQNAANSNNNHTDGAAVIFELPKKGTTTFTANSSDHNKQQQQQQGVLQHNTSSVKDGNNIWLWSALASNVNNLSNKGVTTTRAEWKNSQWHVLIGRPISSDSTSSSSTTNNNGKISLRNGILEKDFIKFAVWDGEKGETIDQVLRANENDKLPHADFILLPSLNTHPRDVYVWSIILVVGVVLFVILEKRLHKNRSSRYTQERENSKGVFP
jgi:DMSO reductase family type II enzyme heme b subunit